MAEWNLQLKDFQFDFVTSEARFPAQVSAWGTGKSMDLIIKGINLSKKYPNNLGLILRKNFTDLRDSTMADFARYTQGRYKIKVQDKCVDFGNGSKIIFHHADELAGVLQNINLGWFGIEQAEEFESEEVFQMLRGRLRRENSSRQGFIVANTNGHNWIWKMWKSNPQDGFDSFEATTFDNASNLPEDFLEDLKSMEEQSPSHYRRYVLNSWEDTDTADRVIPYQKILDAVNRDLRSYGDDQMVVACDPAEFGNDKSVILVLKGLKVIDEQTTTKRELMETAGHIASMSHEHHADVVAIDDVGVGAGVRSRLREIFGQFGVYSNNPDIMAINSGSASGDPRYVRLRDEMWFNAGGLFRDDYVSIPDDDVLIEELGCHTYSMNSKEQRMVVRKKDIKKVIGHSPDRADCLIMGLWAAKKSPRLEPVVTGKMTREENYNPLTWGLD